MSSSQKIQFELEQHVSEVLFYVWDPIGVNLIVSCRDEYEDYVPIIAAHLLNRSPDETINQLLMFIMESWIGIDLLKNARRKSQHQHALKALIEWRDRFHSKYPGRLRSNPDAPLDEQYQKQLDWSREHAIIRKLRLG